MKKLFLMLFIAAAAIGARADASASNELTLTVGELKVQNGDFTAIIDGKTVQICDPCNVIGRTIQPVIMVDYQQVTIKEINGHWIVTKFNCVC